MKKKRLEYKKEEEDGKRSKKQRHYNFKQTYIFKHGFSLAFISRDSCAIALNIEYQRIFQNKELTSRQLRSIMTNTATTSNWYTQKLTKNLHFTM